MSNLDFDNLFCSETGYASCEIEDEVPTFLINFYDEYVEKDGEIVRRDQQEGKSNKCVIKKNPKVGKNERHRKSFGEKNHFKKKPKSQQRRRNTENDVTTDCDKLTDVVSTPKYNEQVLTCSEIRNNITTAPVDSFIDTSTTRTVEPTNEQVLTCSEKKQSSSCREMINFKDSIILPKHYQTDEHVKSSSEIIESVITCSNVDTNKTSFINDDAKVRNEVETCFDQNDLNPKVVIHSEIIINSGQIVSSCSSPQATNVTRNKQVMEVDTSLVPEDNNEPMDLTHCDKQHFLSTDCTPKAAKSDRENKSLPHLIKTTHLKTRPNTMKRKQKKFKTTDISTETGITFKVFSFKGLKSHFSTNEEIANFKCSRCDFDTTNKSDLDRHYRSLHSRPKKKYIYCVYCDYKTSQENIDLHVKTYHALESNERSEEMTF